MTARLWHLYRTELRSHRWVLLLWLSAQLLVAAAAMTVTWLWDHTNEGDFLNPVILQINNWSFHIAWAFDRWVDLTAGLLAAWIALADPLQSPTAFWPTRPARLGEVVLAKALVCFSVFCVIPACCGLLSAWMMGASARDTLLSGFTFLTIKAGWVPLGFIVGILLPAPGRRLSALLAVLGLWLGSLVLSLTLYDDQPDFHDHSLSYLMVWVVALAALPLLLRWRRSVAVQVALAVFAFASPWITGPAMRQLTKVPPRTRESLGMAALSAASKPSTYYFSRQRENDAPKAVVVEMHLAVQGLPADVAAKAKSASFEIEPQPGGKPLHHQWDSFSLVMPTYYAALAHALGTTPDKFPPQWRHQDYPMNFSVPHQTFMEWKDDQALKISGKVRLQLYRVQKEWEGVIEEGNLGLDRRLQLHGAHVMLWMSTDNLSVQTMRPQIADFITLSDFSPEGSLFNNTMASWMMVFQPPVKGADGAFSNELRRTPPLWADCARRNDMADTALWHSGFSTSLRLEGNAPEIREIRKPDGKGLNGLPRALLSRAAYAEVEVTLTPVVLTKQQILDTRKIIPAKP